ncbi:hypothetical protein E2C01_006713 [Portunus trituberculatus]|uniref:Uncharacterized protein n=1 Tax=Portunus trituberculatus TaxID=210409 RepID=A0A5B7CX24_PORTR|nr:hypothetical protein [Portunus trituberculatus]
MNSQEDIHYDTDTNNSKSLASFKIHNICTQLQTCSKALVITCGPQQTVAGSRGISAQSAFTRQCTTNGSMYRAYMCVTAMYHQLVAMQSQHMWPGIAIGQGTKLAQGRTSCFVFADLCSPLMPSAHGKDFTMTDMFDI